MEKKALVRLVIILLGLSYVVFAAAVPAIRTLKSRKVDPSAQQEHLVKEDLDLRSSEELFEMEEGFIEGRMMMNIADYNKPGPNHNHDPRSPGKP